MEFRTIVEVPKNVLDISHEDKMLVIGSCFSEHIGNKLVEAKFRCDVNPFGTLYNPHSILTALRYIQEKKTYTKDDLFFHNEHYHSYMHHGHFSGVDLENVLYNINERIWNAYLSFSDLSYILLTFGSSWAYRLKTTGEVVSNCHKMPANLFERVPLDFEETVREYIWRIQCILKINPSCKFIFSVSPIRHAKDGAHGNQLSKATLLLIIEEIRKKLPEHVFYFPSYEIVIDELRDYRFYNDDMRHPSPMAIDYIWERFSDCFFSKNTQTIVKTCEKIKKDLRHRPFDKRTVAYRAFLKQIVLKIKQIEEIYPNIDFEEEKEQCHTLFRL